MKKKHEFESFLDGFTKEAANKYRQASKAMWLLETTGSGDAADLQGELEKEFRLLFNDKRTYEKLLAWDKDKLLKDPILKRQLNVLIRSFKYNMIPKELLEEITLKEAATRQSYANFRPEFEGKPVSENEILTLLKNEENPARRKKVWEASKKIGEAQAAKILELVELRNRAAKSQGYPDFFTMQLELQEVDGKWLANIFSDLSKKSDKAYESILKEIEQQQCARFKVKKEELGPWAWSEPFCQEDPLNRRELDTLVEKTDIVKSVKSFYEKMGMDVQGIFDRSDMYERPGKNQHAFCMNVDRNSDVRTLNNVKNSIKWLETVLHELGHAVYELGFDPKLPWLLREPPHMITTEAMALIAGRQAYFCETLGDLVGKNKKNEDLRKKAEECMRRRQLIFSRWVLVMTHFEQELYRNPKQPLNKLWWSLVEKYQKIKAPAGRENKQDWAAKFHIGLAPVYYFSYLLGELFASEIEETLQKKTGTRYLTTEKAGEMLSEKLYFPGNTMQWNKLVENVVGRPLQNDAWVKQFAAR